MTTLTRTTDLPTINIASPAFKANPHPFYGRLRAEAPVYRTLLPDKQPVWLITRYDDVLATLKDEQHFSKDPLAAKTPEQLKKMPWIPPMFAALSRGILDTDFAEHARLRGIIHLAFTPRRVEQLRERVQSLAGTLLDAA